MNAQQIINESNFEFHAGNYARKIFKLNHVEKNSNRNDFHEPLLSPHGSGLAGLHHHSNSCQENNPQQDRSGNKLNTAVPESGGFGITSFTSDSIYASLIPAEFNFDPNKNTLKREGIDNFAEVLVEEIKNEN